MSSRLDSYHYNSSDLPPIKADEVPFSRVYISYPREATKQELNDAFRKFGPIEDLWVIKARTTKAEIG